MRKKCFRYIQKTKSLSHDFSVLKTLQILDFILVCKLIKSFPIWCNVNFKALFFSLY